MKKKPIRIRFKKLGREKAAGLAYKDKRLIYIDPNQRGFDMLDTILHECYHIQFPDLSEEAVCELATEMADILWKCQYRMTDNHRK